MKEIATYNLGTVLRETGINADTLRAWERRYGLPTPQRSEGGHRLYSERDIEIIRWLLRQQEAGMRIGQAVKVWRSKVDAGEDPLYEVSQTIETTGDVSQLETFREKWVSACLDFDEVLAEQVANEAFTRFSPEAAFTQIFLPSIRMIGELWYQGKITVQQEHFASALLTRRVDALITTSPLPTRHEKIIVACPPKEEHTLSTLLLTLFLRRRGFFVVYLGTNVPWEEFKETVDRIKPHLVLFTAQQLKTAATLQETIRALSPTGVTIGYSGGIFNTTPNVRNYINAEYLGSDFSNVFSAIEALLRKYPVENQGIFDSPYAELLEAYEIDHIAVHAHLNDTLAQWKFPLKQLAESTTFLSEAITAALYLGDLDLLLPELSWVQALLDNREIKNVGVGQFLRAYANSTREMMGDAGGPLADWLDEQGTTYIDAKS